ncbi:MAG: hypothetical protein M1836_006069 [Candelina mexicana]|nr:MAG: hypothetical protein M1836_006069 [Candelina mexicana]
MQLPGYGGNDLALIIKIVFKLKEIYQKSPDQFQTLSREGLGLEISVKHAIKTSLDDQLTDEHQQQLALLLGTTRELLEKLHAVLQRYESLGTNDYSIWDRFLFGKEDVTHLQEQMRTQSAAFHSFRTDIISTKVTEIKDLLNELLKEKAQAGAITATSSYAVVAQDLTDGLASSGIPQDFISNNGPLIVKLIADLFNKQGYSIDLDKDIDPLSSVVADEKFLKDVVEPEGDDQEIIRSWLSDPDQQPSQPCSTSPKDRSPSFRSVDWDVPSLTHTNSSDQSHSEPEKRKLSLLSRFGSIGSSSVAHDGFIDFFGSARSDSSLKASSLGSPRPSGASMSEDTLQRQRSASSRRSSHVDDVSLYPAGFRTPVNQCTKTKSADSVSNSEEDLPPTSTPPTCIDMKRRPSRSTRSPITRETSSSAVNNIPPSNPLRQNSTTAIGLGIGSDQDRFRQSAEGRPPLKSTPSNSRRKSSNSSAAGSSSSSPKLGLTKVVSSKLSAIGSSYTASGP